MAPSIRVAVLGASPGLVLATLLLWASLLPFVSVPRLKVSLVTETAGQSMSPQVFHSFSGKFSEGASLTPKTFDFVVPGYTRFLRIDPASAISPFSIRVAKVGYGPVVADFVKSSRDLLVGAHAIKWADLGSGLSGSGVGDDPYFVLRIPLYVSAFILAGTACVLLGTLGVSAAGVLLLRRLWFRSSEVVSGAYRPFMLLAILVAVAFALRVAYFMTSPLPASPDQLWKMWPDENTYFGLAASIGERGFNDYFLGEASVMAPNANVVYLWLTYGAFGSIEGIRWLNIALSLATVVFVYRIGAKVFTQNAGLIAALFVTVNWQFVQYSPTLLTEPLFFFLFFAAIAALIELEVRKSHVLKKVALAATLSSIAVLSRSILQLWPGFIIAGSVLASRIQRVSWKAYIPLWVALAVPLVVLAAIVIKNQMFIGKAVVTTGSGAALWLGSRADTEGDDPPYRGRQYGTEQLLHGQSHLSVEGDEILAKAAIDNIKQQPMRYALWNIKKVGRLIVGSNLAWFFPYKSVWEWRNAHAAPTAAQVLVVATLVLTVAVSIYGAVGVVTLQPFSTFGRLLLTGSLAYLIIFSVPFLAIPRYGLPITVFLAMYAGAYLERSASGRITAAFVVSMVFVAGTIAYVFGVST